MKFAHVLILVSSMLLNACQPEDKTSTRLPAEETGFSLTEAEEDDLLLRLSAALVSEPKDQAAIDRNAILNYAIDNLLEINSTYTGLYYQIVREGEGEKIQWGDRLSCHYRGYFLDGQEFDSSYSRQQPIEFFVGEMIGGWNEGLQLVGPGAKLLLLVPSGLGYGEEGLQGSKGKVLVPPNAVLAFEIEVLEKIAD